MSKWLHRFNTVAEYTTARNDNYLEPWVSYTEENTKVNYNKSEYERLLETPLTTIAKGNGTISFNIWKSMGTDMITSVSYSTDGGETWATTNNTNNKSGHLAITVNVNEGDRVMWKANAQQTGYFDEDDDDYGDNIGSFFSSTCEFDVEGNVMSMINDATGLTYDGQLCCLFFNYDGGTECLVVNASKLLLPATTLANNCYDNMFWGCTSLSTAPELPATTLKTECYKNMFWGCTSLSTAPSSIGTTATTMAASACTSMFEGCTSLTTAPELPATTLTDYCYSNMFQGCTGLTTAPQLPATTLAAWCYSGMFGGCTNLTTAPQLPATTLADDCYEYMFQGCTSLTTAPSILPATILANYCYNSMFEGCTSLTTAPELPATTLTSRCYNSMFSYCSNLNYIKCLATDISAINCTYRWVNGVAASGTFVKPASTDWSSKTGTSGIPEGWTVQDAS